MPYLRRDWRAWGVAVVMVVRNEDVGHYLPYSIGDVVHVTRIAVPEYENLKGGSALRVLRIKPIPRKLAAITGLREVRLGVVRDNSMVDIRLVVLMWEVRTGLRNRPVLAPPMGLELAPEDMAEHFSNYLRLHIMGPALERLAFPVREVSE